MFTFTERIWSLIVFAQLFCHNGDPFHLLLNFIYTLQNWNEYMSMSFLYHF